MIRVIRVSYFLLVVIITLTVSVYSWLIVKHPAQATQLIERLPTAAPSHRVPSPVLSTTHAPISPMRLIIPAIKLDTFIEPVGVLPNGELETPAGKPWTDVGWYQSGPVPGQRGSAVIDGHLDRPGGYPAVFWNMRALHTGDTILVINAQGKTTQFRVTQVILYTPQQAPLQAIFGNTSGTYLNLITCAGDWIKAQHQTTLRLVVYATLSSR